MSDNDGFADLAAAAPLEDVGAISQAGAVSVLQGSGGEVTSTGGAAVHPEQPRGAGHRRDLRSVRWARERRPLLASQIEQARNLR
ncbi:MAG: hypothetical protein M3N43_13040, partial [Actinomycetota bacterium]|nr:hypothetical protein [Actinomycetota bacterium]